MYSVFVFGVLLLAILFIGTAVIFISAKRYNVGLLFIMAIFVGLGLTIWNFEGVSIPIVIEIPEQVSEEQAVKIVNEAISEESLRNSFGYGFNRKWLDNIVLVRISKDTRYIDLALIDTFNFKKEIKKQKKLAEIIREDIEQLLNKASKDQQ